MIQTYTYPKDIGVLAKSLHRIDLVLFGEIHGIEENVNIIDSVIDSLGHADPRPLVLAFEWVLTIEEKEHINKFIHGEVDTLPNPPFFADSDGRFTESHRAFLNKLRNNPGHVNITIETFDEETNEDPEVTMANNLLSVCRMHSDALILAETGVMHARKSSYRGYDGSEVTPMALRLMNEVATRSIFIRYQSGEVVVDGETYNITDAASQIEGPGDGFDYELIVECAHPA